MSTAPGSGAEVYRAPLRSRRDDIDPGLTQARALAEGVCGFGGALDPAPADLDTALRLAAEQYDPRVSARIERFAGIAPGALVWTRDADGLFWLGRLDGPWRYDSSAEAQSVDLVHVRDCTWRATPFTERDVPAAVVATFARGGRNVQRIHDDAVGRESQRLW